MPKGEESYYAVKTGHKTGIYRSLKKALEQVTGYPKGEMKKFDDIECAKSYVSGRKRNGKHRKNKQHHVYVKSSKTKDVLKKRIESNPFKHENFPTIYVDGSFMENVSVSSYGYVVELKGEIIQRDFGLILDRDIIKLKSLGSELYACLRAMEWGVANKYDVIRIVYDCEGIIHAINSNKKDSKGRENFLNLYAIYSEHIKVHFKKVDTAQLNKIHRESHHLSRVTVGVLSGSR